VADACLVAPDQRHPIPIHALLGNHDYTTPESPALQRDAVPEFVSNWTLHGDWAELIELGAGVSLIAIDSTKLFHEPQVRGRSLVEALRQSRGPWRVIAAHHPPAKLDPGGNDAGWIDRATPVLRALMAEAGVPVHVWLAGHEHNLQLMAGELGEPSLLLVAGSGSDARRVKTERALLGSASSYGFARIDLVESAQGEVLAASLYQVELENPDQPSLLARARVNRDGNLVAQD